jgi:hypothetical protein
MPMPTKQQNDKSHSSRSIRIRCERIELKAWRSMARPNFSGAIEGYPIGE